MIISDFYFLPLVPCLPRVPKRKTKTMTVFSLQVFKSIFFV